MTTRPSFIVSAHELPEGTHVYPQSTEPMGPGKYMRRALRIFVLTLVAAFLLFCARTLWASVRTKQSGENEWLTRSVNLSKKQVREIARVIDESGLLCRGTELRAGYRVFDLGRFLLTVRTPGVVRELVMDECHTVPDGAAINELLRSLREHAAALGEAFDWGPYAIVSVPGACEREANDTLVPTRKSEAPFRNSVALRVRP